MKKTFKRYMRKRDYAEWNKLFLKEEAIGFNYLNATALTSEPSKEFSVLIKFSVETNENKKSAKKEK